MTNNLKCPFCGAELLGTLCTKYCPNEDCMCYSETISTSVWQALIDGKKAQDALKGIKRRVVAIRSCVQDGYTQLSERNQNIFIALELFKDLIKEITSITKQEEQMSKQNETTVCSIYVSNIDAGWIIHRLDLVEKNKKEIIHQLELLLERMKQEE